MKPATKILFLARWYPDRYDPMTGLFIKRHAEVAAGFANVSVLYLRAAPNKPSGFLIEQTVNCKVVTTIVYYGTQNQYKPAVSKMLSGLLFIKAFVKGYKFIIETWGKPDIIHVNVLTRLGIFALWLKLLRGIPYVITEHWSRYLPITGTYKGLLRKVITKAVVGSASAVSTVSLNLADAMRSHGLRNKHYMVLPNIVDTESYLPVLGKQQTDKKRFIHISCFEDKSKNISGLLHTLDRLSKIRTDFECVLVGEGIDLDNMKALARKLNLNSTLVKFRGLLENEALIEAYQSADFMVMFSNYENMPVVISESFACGLPVIATAVGGIPEYVNAENGRLIAAGDQDALLESLIFMLDHFQEFDAKIIRQKAVDIFGNEAVALKLQELYHYAQLKVSSAS